MSVVEWSAASAAVAFTVLTIGLLLFARAAMIKLAKVQSAADELSRRLQGSAERLERIAEPAEETIRTVNRQLHSVNRLFEAASHIGGTIEHASRAANEAAAVLAKSVSRHAERDSGQRRVEEALDWAELGMAAWQLWQTNRKRRNDADAAHPDE
ncbi:DUF948 domain-containing protein [Paenibacillus sp. NPDC058071]|uniref:DUF948 domain-containing protein n=1 Tax=Paenibacillus sp. NPDC058071 TaxID=3346326 RepID=UPI0036D91FA2